MGNVIGAFAAFKQRWTPTFTVQNMAEGLLYEALTPQGWRIIAPTNIPETTPFSRHVVLLVDAECSFRSRTFPLDVLSEKDLDEAIALDIEQWSPFAGLKIGAGLSSVSFIERHSKHWQVAVWVWPTAVQETLLSQLPANFKATHILPAMAWQAALSHSNTPSLMCHGLGDQHGYALLSSAGVPQSIAWFGNATDARRFWRSQGSRLSEVTQILQVSGQAEEQTPAWLPDDITSSVMQAGAPRHVLLNRARGEGVADWADPISWRRPMLALLALLLVWVVADFAVLTQRSDVLAAEHAEIRSEAQATLAHRDRVAVLQQRLQDVQGIRQNQQRAMRLLAELSQKIPTDIWIDILQLEGDRLDIRGQGKDVARLLVKLEKIKGVRQVLLLNDIRPNSRTGIEKVQLRLILQPSALNTEAEDV